MKLIINLLITWITHVNVPTVLTSKFAKAVKNLTCIMRFQFRISPETPILSTFFALFSCIADQFHNSAPPLTFYILWDSLFTIIQKFEAI